MVTSAVGSICYRFGRFELLPDERQLLADGAAVHLEPHAFDLLVALVERSGKLVTKNDLLALVWPRVVVEENTLQVHVSALRKVLGAEAIATVSGRGYRFVAKVAHGAEPAPAPKHNLPQQLTSFIGREAQVERIKHLLTGTRLLTLTGAGGCGKTRLALQVASDLVDQFADGVWLVELAPLADPPLVPQALARALEVDEQPGKEVTETLIERLGSRHLLILLDNAEHLLVACAHLTDRLLRRCARLVILVTSRERLGIAGELTYRVPSLSVPDAKQDATSAEALACEAARLFIERARLQRPEFDVAATDAPVLASICRRLDGIALAIELAAPRVRHMSLQELSSGLDDRFSLLTGGSRTALPRHRTLRSLIDWSYESLGEREKTVFQRVSVFAASWNVDAAERVCSGGGVDPGAVLDLLTSLADKNLAIVETQGEQTRFGMLETVRHYGQDRLRHSADELSVRARHVDYFLAIADRLDTAGHDDERRVALDRLDKERDNVRAALAWCEAEVTMALTGLELAGKLYWFWQTRGAYSEGRSWIARLLAVAGDAEKGETHARAFHTAATLAFVQDDYKGAAAYHQQALAVWGQLGDRRQGVSSIHGLGNIAFVLGDYPAARAWYGQALAISREFGDSIRSARAVYSLGLVAFETGDLANAQAFLEESVAIGRKFGPWSASRALSLLGVVRHLQGDRPAARTLLNEASLGCKELGDKGGFSRTLAWLALLAHDEGDAAAAVSQTAEALIIQHDLNAPIMLGFTLQAAACVASSFAGPSGVARLLGAAQRVRELARQPRLDFDMQERHELLIASARSALRDDAAFDLAWNEGRSMSLDEAVRYAIALLKQQHYRS